MPPAVAAFERLNAEHASWINDRLPEMLWASLILASFRRQDAFAEFNRILEFVSNHARKADMRDLTLTGISRLEAEPREEFISAITVNPKTARAMASLTMFDSLPGREEWESKVPISGQSVDLLMSAVGGTLWHQSTAATDCRWLRVMGMAAAGYLKIHPKLTEFVEIMGSYPDLEPGCPEGATVRATELAFVADLPSDRSWPKEFWAEAWKKYSCIELVVPYGTVDVRISITWERLGRVLAALKDHWAKTSRDSFLVGIDLGKLKTRVQAYFDSVKVQQPGPNESGFIRYACRPFDTRWLYWEADSGLLDRPRPN